MTDDRDLKSLTVSLPFLESKFNKLKIIPEGDIECQAFEPPLATTCSLLTAVLSMVVVVMAVDMAGPDNVVDEVEWLPWLSVGSSSTIE